MAAIDYKKLYNCYRQIPLAEWANADKSKIVATFNKHVKLDLGGMDESEVGLSMIIAAKVAHQSDENSFREFLESGEVPPIKLSAEEMNALKGGGFFGKIGNFFKKNVGAIFTGAVALVGVGKAIYDSGKGKGYSAGAADGFKAGEAKGSAEGQKVGFEQGVAAEKFRSSWESSGGFIFTAK